MKFLKKFKELDREPDQKRNLKIGKIKKDNLGPSSKKKRPMRYYLDQE